MTCDLENILHQLHATPLNNDAPFHVPSFCSPGCWVVIAALGSELKMPFGNLVFKGDSEHYAKAIKLEQVLHPQGVDTYEWARPGEGNRYSPITALASPDQTDQATQTINNCIRQLSDPNAEGIRALLRVVGELHDNVWAHGMSTGYSMAQKTKIPYSEDDYLEFALADRGIGFKGEMDRMKKPAASHKEAIQWCVQEGNSTKLLNDDGWAQRVPIDMSGGSPYGPNIETRDKENNHQGLGLAKLIELVRSKSGYLRIASGDCLYIIDERGEERYLSLKNEWKGVAISCRFKASMLSGKNDDGIDDSPDIKYIMGRLKGNDDE